MFDLQVWKIQPPNNILVCADDASTQITGIHKLMQRFMILLLTDQGSVRYCRAQQQPVGTLFMVRFRAGEYCTEGDLMAAFDIAVYLVKAQLQAEEAQNGDESDRLQHAKVEKLILTPTSANLGIVLRSTSDEIRFVLSLPTT